MPPPQGSNTVSAMWRSRNRTSCSGPVLWYEGWRCRYPNRMPDSMYKLGWQSRGSVVYPDICPDSVSGYRSSSPDPAIVQDSLAQVPRLPAIWSSGATRQKGSPDRSRRGVGLEMLSPALQVVTRWRRRSGRAARHWIVLPRQSVFTMAVTPQSTNPPSDAAMTDLAIAISGTRVSHTTVPDGERQTSAWPTPVRPPAATRAPFGPSARPQRLMNREPSGICLKTHSVAQVGEIFTIRPSLSVAAMAKPRSGIRTVARPPVPPTDGSTLDVDSTAPLADTFATGKHAFPEPTTRNALSAVLVRAYPPLDQDESPTERRQRESPLADRLQSHIGDALGIVYPATA